MSCESLKFHGNDPNGPLHWMHAFVAKRRLPTIFTLMCVKFIIGYLAMHDFVTRNMYEFGNGAAELTTLAFACTLLWVAVKIMVQFKYHQPSDSLAWSESVGEPPFLCKVQWFAHTLAGPLNVIALIIYTLHIVRGFRRPDWTLALSIVLVVITSLNDMYFGREPYVKAHIFWVALFAFVYGGLSFLTFDNRYPIQDTLIGLALVFVVYPFLLFSERDIFAYYFKGGYVFFPASSDRQQQDLRFHRSRVLPDDGTEEQDEDAMSDVTESTQKRPLP